MENYYMRNLYHHQSDKTAPSACIVRNIYQFNNLNVMKSFYHLKGMLALWLLMILTSAGVKAQVSAYSFAVSTGTYTPITGGTLLNTAGVNRTFDDNVWSAQNIGFTFTYSGTNYTQFGINANGWIMLGNGTPDNITGPYSSLSAGTSNNVISAFNRDLSSGFSFVGNRTNASANIASVANVAGAAAGQVISTSIGGWTAGTHSISSISGTGPFTVAMSANATSTATGSIYQFNFAGTAAQNPSEIRYETIGTAPNRELVVQFSRVKRFGSTIATVNSDFFNFQIRLQETTNTVRIVYGTMSTVATTTTANTVQVGLRGASAADFNNVSSTTSWSSVTNPGASNAATMTISPTVLPASGLTYTWTPPSCLAPSAVNATNVAQTTATINWTAPGTPPSSGYAYEIRTSGAAGSGATGLAASGTTAAGVVTANITGLIANTTYSIYVRSNCGGSGNSAWTTAVTFTTPCNNATLPVNVDFESAAALPTCWQQQFVSGTKAFAVGTTVTAAGTLPNPAAFAGNNRLLFPSYTNSGNQTRLVSPPITTTGIPNVDVNFQWYYSTDGGATLYLTEGVQVQFSTNSGSTWTDAGSLYRRYGATAGWSPINLTLPAAAGNQSSLLVGFLFTSNAGYDSYIDNINVAATPNCPPPTALGTSAIGGSTATLTWTASVAAPPSYDIYYGTNPLTAPTGSTTPTTTSTTTSAAITGLSPNTSYQYYVRAACGGSNGNSTWAGPFNFTTGQIPVSTFPWTDGFEGTFEWSFVNGTQTNQWIVGTATNNGGTKACYISSDAGVTNGYNNASTSVVQVYRDIAFPSNMADGTLSFDWRGLAESCCDYLRVWMVPTNFIPTAGTQTTATGTAPTGRIQLGGNFNNSATYLNQQFTISSAYAGQTVRLVIEWRNDGSVGTAPSGAIDNVNIIVNTCGMPSALTTSGVTGTTATLNWTASVSASPTYDIYWGTSPLTAPTAGTTPTATSSTNSLALTGLSPNTAYTYYVRTNCGTGNTSAWVGPFTFNTTQIPVSTFPWTDGFEGPFQWTIMNGTQTNQWFRGTATNNGGTQACYISNDAGATNGYNNGVSSVVHIYRDISFPAGMADATLSFDWRGLAESCCDYLRVWIVPTSFTPTPGTQITATGTAPTGNIQGGGNLNGNASYSTQTLIVGNVFAGQTVRLVIEWRNDGSVGTAPSGAIDNFNIVVNTCGSPFNLNTTAITGTSATLGWTAPTLVPASYQVYMGPAPLAAPTGSTTGTTVTTNSFNATGLTGNTAYQYYVRSVCGGAAGNGSWIGPVNFSTLISNDLVTGAIPLTCATPVNGTTLTTAGASNDNMASQCGAIQPDAAQTANGVWYKVTGDNQEWTITTCNATGYDSRLSVYSGPATAPTTGSLVCITGNDDDNSCTSSGLRSTVTFTAFSGTTYYVLVHGFGTSTGAFVLSSSCAPGCLTNTPNDVCASPVALTVQPFGAGTYQNTWNTCATPSITEVNPLGESSFATLYDSWYSFNSGQYPQLSLFINNVGVSAPPLTALRYQLYTGVCGSLVESGTVNTTVNIDGTVNTITGLTANTNYRLRVYTTTASARGNFRIKLETPVAPANDNCSGAIVLAQQNGTTCTTPTGGTTQWATQSLTGNGSCAPAVAGSSDDDVWYTFTALSSNPTITVTGTAGFQPAAEIRSATCAGGSAISCSAASAANGTATITTSGLTIGNTYFVRVYSVGTTIATMGTFNICVFGNIPTVTNDGICNATVINVNDVAAFGTYTNIGAITNTLGNTGSSCFTAGQLNADVWFRANIPSTQANRTLVLNFQSVTGAYGDYNVQVFTSADNTCVTGLTEIACNDAGGPGSMPFIYVNMPSGKDVAYIRVTANATGQYSVFQMAATTGVNWTGATSGAWNLNTNWLCTDNIPAVTNNVVIPSGTTNALNFATAQTCNDIELMPGANITVGTGGTLTVNGQWIASVTGNTSSGAGRVIMSGTGTQIQGVTTFSNLEVANNRSIAGQSNNRVDINGELRLSSGVLTTGGNLNLKSTAANTAGFINDFGTNTGTISGGVTVERYINHANYSYLGSPINNASILPWGNIIGGFSANGADGANIIMDPTCSFLQAGTPYSRIMQLNESEITAACLYSGWEVRYSGNLTNGRGYSVLVPAVGTTIKTTGNHNTGTITLPVTKQGGGSFSGVNLVSNPYPSSIDLGAFKAANAGISAIGYTFNGNTSNALSLTAGNFVGSHQGFQVVASTNSTLTFNNSMRVTNSATFYETPAATLTITATSGQGLQDYTQINIGSANATDGYDFDYDGLKFASQNGYPTLFTNIDNQSAMFAINSFPTNLATKVIPMGFMAGTDGTFTLDFQGLDNLPATVMLVLEDKVTGQKKVLNPGVTYTFSSSVSDASDRFNLLLYPATLVNVSKPTCDTEGSVTLTNNSDINWSITITNQDNQIVRDGGFNTSSGNIELAAGSYQYKILTQVGSNGYVALGSFDIPAAGRINGTVEVSSTNVLIDEPVKFALDGIKSDIPTNPVMVLADMADGNTVLADILDGAFTYSYSVPGDYNVVLTIRDKESTCTATQSFLITVKADNTSVVNATQGNINAYSVNDQILITFPDAIDGKVNVKLYDLAGKLILSEQFVNVQKGQKQMSASKVVKGIYILNIESDKTNYSKKILLNPNN
jgi:hypothetical protein